VCLAAYGSEGHRFEATQALRQVLNRAVSWKLIDENPAKRGVPTPGRRCREQRPFESWAQIGSLTEVLGPTFGPAAIPAGPPTLILGVEPNATRCDSRRKPNAGSIRSTAPVCEARSLPPETRSRLGDAG
jgi:hypothetical protein